MSEIYDLAKRLNEIRTEIVKLEIEMNIIIDKLWEENPKLKENPDIQKCKVRKF